MENLTPQKIPQKFCTSCTTLLPLSTFQRRYKKNSLGERKPKGYFSSCNTCRHKKDKAREKLARAPRVALRIQARENRAIEKNRKKSDWQEIQERNRFRLSHKSCYYCQNIFPRTEEFFVRSERGSLSRACIKCEHLKGLGSEKGFRHILSVIIAQRDHEALNKLSAVVERKAQQNPKDALLSATLKLLVLVGQNDFCCAICGLPNPKPKIDHDHITAKVRGVLCHKCNLGLGYFNDNPNMLRRAAEYLTVEKSPNPSVDKVHL
jgi:hypothetical protein